MNKNNIFTNKKKQIPLVYNDESFPSLSKQIETSDNSIAKIGSYAEKLNRIVEETENKDILQPGWVKITIDKNNKIQSVYNPGNKSIDNHVDYLSQFKINIEPMFERWENFKKNYIELYGEDDYSHYYKFPNYDYSYLYKEEDEEDNSDLEIYDLIEEDY